VEGDFGILVDISGAHGGDGGVLAINGFSFLSGGVGSPPRKS
jgi:hypothetical protein